jgi:hypothetical protein
MFEEFSQRAPPTLIQSTALFASSMNVFSALKSNGIWARLIDAVESHLTAGRPQNQQGRRAAQIVQPQMRENKEHWRVLTFRRCAGIAASLRSGNFSAEMTSQYFEAHFLSAIFIGENCISGSM